MADNDLKKQTKLTEIEQLKKRLEELGVRTIEREGVFVAIRSPVNKDFILFVKHRDDGKWSMPGGGIKQAEIALDAAIRECLEETGLSVRINPIPIAHLSFEIKYGFYLLFESEITENDSSLRNLLLHGNDNDVTECRFFHIDHLPSPIYNAQKGNVGWLLSWNRQTTQYGHPNKPPIEKYRTEHQ